VRRLADAIGYSQPVLYGHFPDGRDGIVRAVALDGFGRITAALDAAPRSADAKKRVRAVVQRYLRFAHDNPAVYEAMFSMPTELAFATKAAPAPLRQAFAAIQRAVPRLRQRPRNRDRAAVECDARPRRPATPRAPATLT
jgi:AcrR family transcriptional regulator